MLAERVNKEKPYSFQNADSASFFNCYLKNADDLTKHKLGQKVTLRGKMADRRYMVECELVSGEGESIPRLSASKFAKAFIDSKEDFVTQYKDALVVLEGVIARNNSENTVDGFSVPTIMKGNDQIEIGLHRSSSDQTRQFENLSPGDQVVVIGKFIVGKEGDKELPIGLHEACRLELK